MYNTGFPYRKKQMIMKAENPNIERILDKLRKLMDLKESATLCGEFGEANAAAAGITRLLREYDLTLQDIPAEQKEKDPVEIEVVSFKCMYMNFPWYGNLLATVALYNNARILRSRCYNTSGNTQEVFYKVVGRKKNREIVLYLVSYLTHQFINLGQKTYPNWKYETLLQTGKTPPSRTLFMKSYLMGCVYGLDQKLNEEQKADASEKLTALVKASQTEIDDFLANMNVKKGRSRSVSGIDTAMAMGQEAGRNISLHEGIEGNTTRQKLLDM